jgi:hypothetical protein
MAISAELVLRCWRCRKLFLLREFDELIDDPDADPIDGIEDPAKTR